MPTWTRPLAPARNIGPPESPWQVSTPPDRYPAQISSAAMTSPSYALGPLQTESLTKGTLAFIRYRCCAPPSRVAPHPATVNVPLLYAVDVAIGSVARPETGLASRISAQSLPAPL